MMPSGQDWRSSLEEQELPPSRDRFSRGVILTSSSMLLLIVITIVWPILQFKVNAVSAEASTPLAPTQTFFTAAPSTPTATSTAFSSPTQLPTKTESTSPPAENTTQLDGGLIVLAINEAGYSHLFAYQPYSLPYTRLTSGPWDDITPALSPNGRWLAFASNRSGSWDLYILDLQSGILTRLTDTPEYEASPSWSPDGNLLAYEAYSEDSEIFIRSVFDDQILINLSEHPAADYEPTWSPQGRQIAFISTRSGEPEVWIADFDRFGEERFTNLSQNPNSRESHPAWAPDGNAVAWSTLQDENHSIYIWEPDNRIRYLASGDCPVWSTDSSIVLTPIYASNQTTLTAYQAADSLLALPPVVLPGSISCLTWGSSHNLPQSLQQIAEETPQAPWAPETKDLPDVPAERQHLVPLNNVVAPYPQLHDRIEEAFQALRARVAEEAGWDFLGTLENAFVPLNSPLPPGMGEDWLYTGRAFAFDTLPMNTNWVVVVPEKFGHQTYWRVYVKARFQNGSQGKPMHDLPWNFNSRHSGDPLLYEQGGYQSYEIPSGYWVNFTDLAIAYGWERLPALPTWQSAFFAARFNEFVIKDGLTWEESMLELYPAEALVTPTPIFPPTLTPTRTPSWPIRSTPSP
jgi:TolB protein